MTANPVDHRPVSAFWSILVVCLFLLFAVVSRPAPPQPDPREVYQDELAALAGVEQQRRYALDRYEFDLADAEAGIARTRHIPVEQVKQNPSPEIARAVEAYKTSLKERLQGHLDRLAEEEARQKERVRRAKETVPQYISRWRSPPLRATLNSAQGRKGEAQPMTILFSERAYRYEFDGRSLSTIPLEHPYGTRTTIRVGTHNERVPGPLGTTRWSHDSAGRPYQEIEAQLIGDAKIVVHGLSIPCLGGTIEELRLLDATFALVPPDHLQRVLRSTEKPEGFHVVGSTPRGAGISYMGGANVARDDPLTPFDDTRCILITHGALWQNRELRICPTVFHEIGHIMTHNNGLSYETFDATRRQQLAAQGTSGEVSRNAGELEALCNAYMYFLCYGAEDGAIRRYGDRAGDPQRDATTRGALRRLPAFTRLPSRWRSRYDER